jgi:hypothetical protein
LKKYLSIILKETNWSNKQGYKESLILRVKSTAVRVSSTQTTRIKDHYRTLLKNLERKMLLLKIYLWKGHPIETSARSIHREMVKS